MSKKNKRPIPVFDHPIIETHCHLDYLDAEDLNSVLEKSSAHGIEKIITIAVSPDNLDKVIALVTNNTQIFGSQGVHPHDASKFSAACLEKIKTNLTNEKILAVGEIGLDYFYEHSEREVQKKVFEQQLQLAADNDYPIIVHTRDADEDTQAILKNFSPLLKRKGVIHSFSSSLPLAEFCLAEGFHLGFNGMVTFKKAENVRDAVSLCPIEQLLLETDSPYLTPDPYRGRQNAPFFLPFIAEKIAAIKNLEIDVLLKQCHQNSESLFFQDHK
jgi:TatD DNase family protein